MKTRHSCWKTSWLACVQLWPPRELPRPRRDSSSSWDTVGSQILPYARSFTRCSASFRQCSMPRMALPGHSTTVPRAPVPPNMTMVLRLRSARTPFARFLSIRAHDRRRNRNTWVAMHFLLPKFGGGRDLCSSLLSMRDNLKSVCVCVCVFV